MKKALFFLSLLLLAAAVYFLPIAYTRWQWSRDKDVAALLLYNPRNLEAVAYVGEAYASVLEEEGVPFRQADAEEAMRLDAADLAARMPALILPDGILQNTPSGFAAWVDKYLAAGGSVAAIYDVGTKNSRGKFRERAELAGIVGINYIVPGLSGRHPYVSAKIQFSSPQDWEFFQMTPGRDVMDFTLSGVGGGFTLSGVSGGAAQYSVAYNEMLGKAASGDIRAFAVTDSGEKMPAITLSDYKKGKLLYVNLPLGHLKANSDDMLLRSIMRAFLFDVAALPHLLNVEDGIGGLVFNLHFFLRMADEDLEAHIERGFLNEKVPMSIHIAAADYLEKPGDDMGFDAAGRGREQAEILSGYGRIGSLGGMANNWFSKSVETAGFGVAEMKKNIDANNKLLEEITGYKITEYSAPAGLHPQPAMTRAIEGLGLAGYSYIYEYSAAPNRTFVNRRRVSDQTIAFPLLSFGRHASLWELYLIEGGQETEEALDRWMQDDLLPYIGRQRTVRTLMVNEHNMFAFPDALRNLVEYLADAGEDGQDKVRALTMGGYADFLLRFLKTKYTFTQNGGGLSLDLKNPDTLRGIVAALPKARYGRPSGAGLVVTEDEKYYYAKVGDPDAKEKIIDIPLN